MSAQTLTPDHVVKIISTRSISQDHFWRHCRTAKIIGKHAGSDTEAEDIAIANAREDAKKDGDGIYLLSHSTHFNPEDEHFHCSMIYEVYSKD